MRLNLMHAVGCVTRKKNLCCNNCSKRYESSKLIQTFQSHFFNINESINQVPPSAGNHDLLFVSIARHF